MKATFLEAQTMLNNRTFNNEMLRSWAFAYLLFDTYYVGRREFKTTLNQRINARGIFTKRYKL